jgi:hypothetical protein
MGGLNFWLGCSDLGRLFLWGFRLLTQVKSAQAAIEFVVFFRVFSQRWLCTHGWSYSNRPHTGVPEIGQSLHAQPCR